jgi:adenine-specific DNA-methyltransferase
MLKLSIISPKKATKSIIKQKTIRTDIDLFKANLIVLLNKLSIIEKQPKDESEEHLKNNVRDFLRDTYYKDSNAINTKDKKDLVIHTGKSTQTEVGVIIEAKRPSNTAEMLTADNPNKKALHELVLYYLDERNSNENNQLKHLVITNVYEWYLIDANFFDKHIYRNAQIKKLYETKQNDKKDNPWFYEELAKIIAKLDIDIPCVYFDIRHYENYVRNDNKEDDKELSALYKLFSANFLLKIATANDSNSLNAAFYKELLHIIGLEEAKEGGKNIIRRKKENRNPGSLLELCIDALITEDVLHHVPDLTSYGNTKDERIFNVALELCITWINRILFLKLLEGQLLAYNKNDNRFKFLSQDIIFDFDELFKLFHKVLAVDIHLRTETIQEKYANVPYLNSSLFEISELEDQTIKINTLDNRAELEIYSQSVLSKDAKKKNAKLISLHYLFQFLNAFDFASDGTNDIQEENKTIINASVLGKVFEKINGYKDGSIYTPAFITMYMCRESIRMAVIDKFNEYLLTQNIQVNSLEEIYEHIIRKVSIQDANKIINSLKICDPSVGSGHFLVSALNEIIAIKAELGILVDETGKTLRGYTIEIADDELLILDENNDRFVYNPLNKESNRVQKTLFHEKQSIIEKCLFGVDINPNSVKICRLRLWIELLKNAYYKAPSPSDNLSRFVGRAGGEVLETLPNIDINIKCGNSLLSRFALDADLSKALRKSKWNIQTYQNAIYSYHHATQKEQKREIEQLIKDIKSNFETEIANYDPRKKKLAKLGEQLFLLTGKGADGFQNLIFEPRAEYGDKEMLKKRKKEIDKLEKEIEKISVELEEAKSNAIYKNAFEWRFEFPEVLSNNGDFIGFDIIIGNPPYIQLQQNNGELAKILQNQQYQTFTKTGDIYMLFYEKGFQLTRKNGYQCLITSSQWLKAAYGASLRRHLLSFENIKLISLGPNVFENATVDTNILLSQNKENSNKLKGIWVENEESFINKKYEIIEMPYISAEAWIIMNLTKLSIKNKLIQYGKPLSSWEIKINFGIKTGLNEAFVIDEAKKDEIIKSDPKSAEIIKPILRGREIKKYFTEWDGGYLISTFPSLKIKIDNYVGVKKYLKSFGKKLEQVGEEYIDDSGLKVKTRKKTSNNWFEKIKLVFIMNSRKRKLFGSVLVHNFVFLIQTLRYFR